VNRVSSPTRKAEVSPPLSATFSPKVCFPLIYIKEKVAKEKLEITWQSHYVIVSKLVFGILLFQTLHLLLELENGTFLPPFMQISFLVVFSSLCRDSKNENYALLVKCHHLRSSKACVSSCPITWNIMMRRNVTQIVQQHLRRPLRQNWAIWVGWCRKKVPIAAKLEIDVTK